MQHRRSTARSSAEFNWQSTSRRTWARCRASPGRQRGPTRRPRRAAACCRAVRVSAEDAARDASQAADTAGHGTTLDWTKRTSSTLPEPPSARIRYSRGARRTVLNDWAGRLGEGFCRVRPATDADALKRFLMLSSLSSSRPDVLPRSRRRSSSTFSGQVRTRTSDDGQTLSSNLCAWSSLRLSRQSVRPRDRRTGSRRSGLRV